MIRDPHNIIPVTLALLLHAAIVSALVVVLDFSRPSHPVLPLAVTATLVTDSVVALPPVVREPEPELVEPDPGEQQRIQAEAEKRAQDALIEKQRLEELRKQQLADEAERKRLAAEEEARRKREEDERLERQRVDAERKRQEDIERQRLENERIRLAEAAAIRSAEFEAEDRRLAAVNAGALEVYQYAIKQKIERNWIRPASAGTGIECEVSVRQVPGGEVVGVTIGRCNGDAAVQRSIEAAVYKASPLPEPSDPSIFQRNLLLTFKPDQ